jgi:protein-L-isoaspartate O-methyltransferase
MYSSLKKCVPAVLKENIKRLVKGPADYKELYGKHVSCESVAFREYEDMLRNRQMPERYQRLLPYIKGDSVLEIGAAEGIFSLMLSATKSRVLSVDITPARHEGAKKLQDLWLKAGHDYAANCEYICGDIFERFELLESIDTVVASRVIYYFQERLDDLLTAIAKNAHHVVLVGNADRAEAWETRGDGMKIGKYAYYATTAGMKDLLQRHGYTVTDTVVIEDPVVVGVR